MQAFAAASIFQQQGPHYILHPSIAGNIYTEKVEGINFHKYGAHIFHTNNKTVWDYLQNFTVFNRFTNSPVANYKGELSLALCRGSYRLVSEINGGLVPTMDISPPDVKIETTFFQRNFFSTIPCNYPQKQHKKRTSDLSEVPILRCFLKILPLSASLPASYQIPPDCTPNGIFPSNDTSFPHPIRTFSISFAALAHY